MALDITISAQVVLGETKCKPKNLANQLAGSCMSWWPYHLHVALESLLRYARGVFIYFDKFFKILKLITI